MREVQRPSASRAASTRPAAARHASSHRGSPVHASIASATSIEPGVPYITSFASEPRPARTSSWTRSASATIVLIASSTRSSSHSSPASGSCSPGRKSSANARKEESAALAHHLAGDHEPLDLLRPLVDLRDLRVAHEALDGVFPDVAVAAEDLHRVGGDGHRDVAALELRHRGGLRQLLPLDALVDHAPVAVEEP